jgi:3-dehydroquinate synthase
VSLGIVAEARLAERRGFASAATTERQERLLERLGLPVRLSGVNADAVVAAIRHDKKSRDGQVPFVLAPAIGTFRIVHDVTDSDVRAVLTALGA